MHIREWVLLYVISQSSKLGGRGSGTLTMNKCQTLQNYYRGAIINNIGNKDNMRKAVWASLMHCLSTDQDPQHNNCPMSSDTWCFFNKALTEDCVPPPHKENMKTFLSNTVGEALLPIYTRMSDPNLLHRLSQGKTQNPNESLHNCIWSGCPKTIFVGLERIQAGVASGVSKFNSGALQLTDVMNKMSIEVTSITTSFLETKDRARIMKAEKAAQHSFKAKRKKRDMAAKVVQAKLTHREGPSYAPGGF